MQVYTRSKKKLLSSCLAFTLKEGPVRCAKVCYKSWVILRPQDLEHQSQIHRIPLYLEVCTYLRHNELLRAISNKKKSLPALGFLSKLRQLIGLMQQHSCSRQSRRHIWRGRGASSDRTSFNGIGFACISTKVGLPPSQCPHFPTVSTDLLQD